MNRPRQYVIGLALGLALVASVGLAQRRFGEPTRWATPNDYDGAFMFCRIAFRSNAYGDGARWDVDYPRADINLSFRFSELTKTLVSHDPNGDIRHVVVTLTDPLMYRCPFIMMTEVGNSFFDPAEAAALKDYLLKGGFLWADDFWGTRAWDVWAGEIGKALPPSQFPIVDLPLDHELFHTLYDVRRMPQVPGIGYWLFSGGGTSERGADSAQPHARAIVDDRERETDNHEYFLTFAPEGYAFGVNALVYGMTH